MMAMLISFNPQVDAKSIFAFTNLNISWDKTIMCFKVSRRFRQIIDNADRRWLMLRGFGSSAQICEGPICGDQRKMYYDLNYFRLINHAHPINRNWTGRRTSAAVWFPIAGFSLNTSQRCKGRKISISNNIPVAARWRNRRIKTPNPKTTSIIPAMKLIICWGRKSGIKG